MRFFARPNDRGFGRFLGVNWAIGPGVVVGMIAGYQPAAADADTSAGSSDLAQLSIEDLANIQVSSVSKSAERLSDAPAAIYVITHDDIVRSGANSIPEMLRLAPNLEVAQVSANSYAISARGFNGTLADKLLVLIDGRSVYSPLYAGVYWDVQDVLPEDIDRIEVISGPGGTLWGANAVNGVINIITRKSSDTQGGVANLGGGNLDRDGNLQYGGRVSDDLAYRVYGDRFMIADDKTYGGTLAGDAWQKSQSGFRVDWSPTGDTVTVQGDAYAGGLEQLGTGGAFISGDNLLTRWTHAFDGGSNLQVQAYYDGTRSFVSGSIGAALNTFDLDVQHSFTLNDWNKIVWGGGERTNIYQITNTATFRFSPSGQTLNLANAFVEDTISVTDTVKLIAGAKLEDEPYVGPQFMPSLRASWKITDTNLLWAAVSRAVRSPTPFDRDVQEFNGGALTLAGGSNFESENLTAYEIGYRTQPTTSSSLSISTFYNHYDDLRSIGYSPVVFPLVYNNLLKADTYGVEMWGNYRVNDWWRLSAGLTIEHENFTIDLPVGAGVIGQFEKELFNASVENSILQETGDDPTHQASLRSSMNITRDVTFDADLREVGALPNPAVPAYVELNSRIGWTVSPSLLLSLSGFNLLHPQHIEFGATPGAVEVGRSFMASAQVRF